MKYLFSVFKKWWLLVVTVPLTTAIFVILNLQLSEKTRKLETCQTELAVARTMLASARDAQCKEQIEAKKEALETTEKNRQRIEVLLDSQKSEIGSLKEQNERSKASLAYALAGNTTLAGQLKDMEDIQATRKAEVNYHIENEKKLTGENATLRKKNDSQQETIAKLSTTQANILNEKEFVAAESFSRAKLLEETVKKSRDLGDNLEILSSQLVASKKTIEDLSERLKVQGTRVTIPEPQPQNQTPTPTPTPSPAAPQPSPRPSFELRR